MVSKLKQRRLRRLKADVWWWRQEAADLHARVMEQANEIDALKQRVIHVVMPMMVPPAIVENMKARRVDHVMCVKCNEGARGGCSACAYNIR